MPKALPRYMTPPLTILVKLGSIAVHVDEMLSDNGHPFDDIAVHSLLSDPELIDWMALMDAAGFLPKKRR